MSKIFKEVVLLPEFQRDLKKLQKKFRTLDEDLQIFIKNQLILFHKYQTDNRGIFPIPALKINYPKLYKARKFSCRSLPGTGVYSGIRVIYAYFEKEDKIELIEIYYKGNKDNEDRERILKQYT